MDVVVDFIIGRRSKFYEGKSSFRKHVYGTNTNITKREIRQWMKQKKQQSNISNNHTRRKRPSNNLFQLRTEQTYYATIIWTPPR